MASEKEKAEASAKEWIDEHVATFVWSTDSHEASLTDLILSVQEETRRENAGLELKALKRGDHFKAKLAERDAEVKLAIMESGLNAETKAGLLRRLGMER